MNDADFDKLATLFKSADSLPDLPAAALQLCEAIDKGVANTAELERYVLGDPAITAGLLRAANSALYGGRTHQASTVQGSIMLLGQKAVRSIAVSVWVQALVQQAKAAKNFDPQRFAEHSMFVGFMSKYLLSRATKIRGLRSAWTPDELFAAGVLHDLGVGLMALVNPDLYNQVHTIADAKQMTPEYAFFALTGRSIAPLGAMAAGAWRLPPMFGQVILGFSEPFASEDEQDALCCVYYANYLADSTGRSITGAKIESTIDPAIQEKVGIDEEDINDIVELVSKHTREYVAAA